MNLPQRCLDERHLKNEPCPLLHLFISVSAAFFDGISAIKTVEQHLSTRLTLKIKVHESSNSKLYYSVSSHNSRPFSVPSHRLYSQFSGKGQCCTCVGINILCSRDFNLVSSKFSSLSIKLSSHFSTKFVCFVTLPQNFTACLKICYLKFKILQITFFLFFLSRPLTF